MRSASPDSTTRSVLAATLACAAVVAHLVAAKAARDALFLASFHVSLLPRMMMAGALVSLITALVVARVLERLSPARLLLVALFTNAALYACEWKLLETATRAVAVALYLQVSALAATLVAGLWSVVNERFDPHAARPAVGRVALGGSFGGVLGGIAGWLVSGSRGISPLLAMLLCLNLAAMGAVVLLARSSRAPGAAKPVREPARRTSALGALRESPYLRTLAVLVGMGALTSALLDYVLSSRLVARFPDAAELAGFFALFHACVGLLAVLVQLVFTRSALERIGLAGTIALLPLSVLVMGAGALAFKQLWSAVLLRGSEGLAQASVFRAAYELAYTPLPRSQKRPTKMLIDVGIDRIGTIAGAGVALLVVAEWGARADAVLTSLAMLGALGALYCTSKLHRGYVDALAGRLRRGTLTLDERRVFDATTRRTLAETASLDRQALLAAIERRQSEPPHAAPSAPPAESEQSPETLLVGAGVAGFEAAPGYVGLRLGTEGVLAAEDADSRDILVRALVELRCGDTDRIHKVLAQPLLPELAAHVVPLLGRDEVALNALHALRAVAERITGTLSDALSDPAQSVIVRRRIPRVLERCPTSRGIRTLIDGLFDSELDVRHQSALALLRMQEITKSVKLPRERIIDALEIELSSPSAAPTEREATHPFDDQPRFGSDIAHEHVRQDVEHVMTLLALVLRREHVQLAYHALYADEPAIRGTALEYLENVLPERVRSSVLELVESLTAPAPRRVARRDRETLLEELQRSRELVMPASLREPKRSAGS